MGNKIKVRPGEFYEVINILNKVNIELNSSINKLVSVSNSLQGTWNSKSGDNFIYKNKMLILNMKLLSTGINDLAIELNNINSAYEEMDSLISSKIDL